MEEASTGSGPFFSQLINLGLPWKSVYGQLPPPAPISFRPSPKHGVVIFLPLYLSNIWNRKAKSPKSKLRLCIFICLASPSQTGSAQRSFFQIFLFNPSLSLGPKTKDSILKFISNLFMLTKLYTVLNRLRKRYCVLIVLPLKQLNSRQLIISNNEHFPRKSPSCGTQYHGELLKTSLKIKFPQLASWTGDNWILSNFISESTSGAAPNTIKDKNSIWHMIQMLWLIYWYKKK